MKKIKYPEPVDLSLYKKDAKDLHAKFGLPKEIAFCKKCVISNQRPNSAVEYQHTKDSKKATINFDADGVCDACNFTEKKNASIDWLDREVQLKELCDHPWTRPGLTLTRTPNTRCRIRTRCARR